MASLVGDDDEFDAAIAASLAAARREAPVGETSSVIRERRVQRRPEAVADLPGIEGVDFPEGAGVGEGSDVMPPPIERVLGVSEESLPPRRARRR